MVSMNQGENILNLKRRLDFLLRLHNCFLIINRN